MATGPPSTQSIPPAGDVSVAPQQMGIQGAADANESNRSRHYLGPLLTFSIGGRIFRVLVNTLTDGKYFKQLLNELNLGGGNEDKSNATPIAFDAKLEVTAMEMESFLDILLWRSVSGVPPIAYERWLTALELADKWSFEGVKTFCIGNMTSVLTSADAFEIIRVADKYKVKRWLPIAFKKLCERTTMLTADEGAKLGYRRLTAVCRVMEQRMNPLFKCERCVVCKSGAFSFTGTRSPFSFTPKDPPPSVCTRDVTKLLEKEKDLQEVGL